MDLTPAMEILRFLFERNREFTDGVTGCCYVTLMKWLGWDLTATNLLRKAVAVSPQSAVTVMVGQIDGKNTHSKVVFFKVGYSVQSAYNVPVNVAFQLLAYGTQGNV